MFEIYPDADNPKITRWKFDNRTTWEDFHKGIDGLKEQAQEATEPFSIIVTTTGQMPRGNALSHLKRLIKIVGNYDMIERFVVINHKQNPVGQAFVGMALKLFAQHDKLKIVQSEEEALALV